LFFRQVAQLRDPATSIQLNGQPTTLRYVTLEETIALTAREAEQLRTAADDCNSAIRAIQAEHRPGLLLARLDAIASEPAAARLSAETKARERRMEEVVLRRLNDLRREMGETAFHVIDSYVSKHPRPWAFFPLVKR
jgi:hypothetical protein